MSSSGVRQPPPYDSVPPHYDQPSSLIDDGDLDRSTYLDVNVIDSTPPSHPPPPPPQPAPPLPPDDRRRHADQAPISQPPASAAAQSGRSAPASNRPERPPPPAERPRDERGLQGQHGDSRQRDNAYVLRNAVLYSTINLTSFKDEYSVLGSLNVSFSAKTSAIAEYSITT